MLCWSCRGYKTGVKELIIAIGQSLPYLPVGVEVVIEDPKPEDPLRVKFEMPEDEEYEWKLSLYNTMTEGPDMILRFTFEGMGAKGRIIWKMLEENEELAQVVIHLENEHAIDVTFDGTTYIRTLYVRFTQDLSEIIVMEASGLTLLINQAAGKRILLVTI